MQMALRLESGGSNSNWAEAQFEVSQDGVNSRIKHVYPVVVLSGVFSCVSGCGSIDSPTNCPWLRYAAVQKRFSHVRCFLEQFAEGDFCSQTL